MKTTLMDNLPEGVLRARDVRHLTSCAGCGGIGDSRLMIMAPSSVISVFWHTKCWLRRHTFQEALLLSTVNMGKIRLCDLSQHKMKRLLEGYADRRRNLLCNRKKA